MDPLSEILALMKPQTFVSGGFAIPDELSFCFPRHRGIKCYAMLAGQCWLVVEGVAEPVHIQRGDCFLLPHGRPFQLTTDLALEPISYLDAFARFGLKGVSQDPITGARAMAGGHFLLTGPHAGTLLQSLPPVVHLRREADREAMRWSLQRMREELSAPQPGGSLVMQQLASMLLVQALRLHLAEGQGAGPGWLAGLADVSMSVALTCMHEAPGHPWTLQSLAEKVGMSRSVFALRFREVVGTTPMEYLVRWRMLVAADRLGGRKEGLGTISASLGYQSESAFGKAFRRVMGCSPRRYARAAAQA